MQNNLENIVRIPKQHICKSCIKRYVVTFSYTFTYKYILHQLIYYFLKIWIAIFGVKARKADSGTMRMKRSLLVKVGEALAPDAFQLVLDSESDTKGRGHNSHTPRYPYRKENHTCQCIFILYLSVIVFVCFHSDSMYAQLQFIYIVIFCWKIQTYALLFEYFWELKYYKCKCICQISNSARYFDFIYICVRALFITLHSYVNIFSDVLLLLSKEKY